jgi:hypothetical protein
MGELADAMLSGSMCGLCGVPFFPEDEVVLGDPEAEETHNYGQVTVDGVPGIPIYHADCSSPATPGRADS